MTVIVVATMTVVDIRATILIARNAIGQETIASLIIIMTDGQATTDVLTLVIIVLVLRWVVTRAIATEP